jgi:hypothetical protein
MARRRSLFVSYETSASAAAAPDRAGYRQLAPLPSRLAHRTIDLFGTEFPAFHY